MIIFNKTFWAILLSTLIFMLASAWFVGKPLVESAWQAYGKKADNKQQITSLEEKLASLQSLKKNQTKVSDIYQKAENFLPKEKNEGQFAVQIEDQAGKAGLTLNNLTFTATQKQTNQTQTSEETTQAQGASQETTTNAAPKEKYPSVGFSTDLTSGWSQLLSLLQLIENGARSNNLYTLSINKGEGDNLAVKIEGVIYYKSSVLENDQTNTNISPELERKFETLGQSVPALDLTHGFGRENPFASY